MDKDDLKLFRSRVRRVSLPDDVRESVLQAARSGKATGEVRPAHIEHLHTRRTVLRMGAVAAGTAAVLMGLSIFGKAHDGNSASGGNFFVLKAYAEGTPQDDNTVLALGNHKLDDSYSWSESDDDELSVSCGLDLECTGTGIQSITYELEGKYVGLSKDSTNGSLFFDSLVNDPAEGEFAGESGTSFTLSYDGQDDDKEKFTRNINAVFPIDDELKAAIEELDQLDGYDDPEHPSDDELRSYLKRLNKVDRLSRKSYNALLSQTTLVMTATFADGSTQERRYVIAPCEDFDEVYANWLESRIESDIALNKNPDDKKARANSTDAPQLYTITETDA